MIRTVLAVLFFAGAAATAMGTTAPCSIQRAAFSGEQVWLLCDQNELLVSTDHGNNWQTKRLPGDARLRAIALLDARRGFAAGDAGTLLATEDGAETWRPVTLPASENLAAIHFVGDHGWIAGWTGIILHSGDGGKTWERQSTGVQQGLEDIYFADTEHGWAVGWLGLILYTSDGGKTWAKAKTPGALWSLDAVRFKNAKEGWAVGFGGQLLRSTDGGATWEQQASPVREWLKSVACDGLGRWWVASANSLLVSENGGESWVTIPVEGSYFLHQVALARETVWAVGQFGVLRQSGSSFQLTALATLPEGRQWREGVDQDRRAPVS